jgi:hypothetical protein
MHTTEVKADSWYEAAVPGIRTFRQYDIIVSEDYLVAENLEPLLVGGSRVRQCSKRCHGTTERQSIKTGFNFVS